MAVQGVRGNSHGRRAFERTLYNSTEEEEEAFIANNLKTKNLPSASFHAALAFEAIVLYHSKKIRLSERPDSRREIDARNERWVGEGSSKIPNLYNRVGLFCIYFYKYICLPSSTSYNNSSYMVFSERCDILIPSSCSRTL